MKLRVEDLSGRSVTAGAAYHPGGREELVAVRLRPRLDGTYVARFRVISEDGHPVGERMAFRVRRPKPAGRDEQQALRRGRR